MKVAFATSTGVAVDLNFRSARDFTVWNIEPGESCYVTTVTVDASPDDPEGGIIARADALAGCTMVFTREINGPAAAKLVARSIQPLKTGDESSVEGIIGKLEKVLRGTPPPWLKKMRIRDTLCDEDGHVWR